MRNMLSLRPLLVTVSILALPILGGSILAGCGSSSSTATGGGTITVTEEGDQEDGEESDPTSDPADQGSDGQNADQDSGQEFFETSSEGVYARGRVIYPDTSAAPRALVYTEPSVQSIQADSLGRFQFTEPFPEEEYTFVARHEDVQGRTIVEAPADDLGQKIIWIMVGAGEKSLDAISIDSVRASPGGPGLNRTGN